MSSHAQTYLDLPVLPLVGLEQMTTFKIKIYTKVRVKSKTHLFLKKKKKGFFSIHSINEKTEKLLSEIL